MVISFITTVTASSISVLISRRISFISTDVSQQVSVPKNHKHGTIFRAPERIVKALLEQDRIHYTGTTMADPSRHDGALSPVVGVHNIQTLRANREHPSQANGEGWTYNHQPMMAYWNGKFYMHFPERSSRGACTPIENPDAGF